MQNTSSKYKDLVKQSGRTFKAKVICTFADGTQKIFTDSDIMQNGLKISDATSNECSFDVGCAIIKELVLELDNSNKQLADIDFNGASFDVRIGLVIEQKYDNTTKVEWIKKGIYYTEEITENENFVSIVAYDAMAKFDKPYSSSLKFPQMLLSIFSDACTACGVPYASLNFPNATFYVQSKDFINDNTTYRDIISYVAQLACCFVRVDVDGIVHMRWYEDTNREITERQKIFDDVTVTCALITTADEDKTYIIGHSGYAVNIEDNPLAQGSANTLSKAFTDNILEKNIVPFDGEMLSDPSLEAGDIVTIYDYSGNDYKTYITSVTFNIDNKMQIACDAETFNEKNRAGGSQSATIIAMAKKQTEIQLSDYAIRAQQFNALTANSMGFYQTIKEQDDGSQIIYQHDKPLLGESKTIWKKSGDTASVSIDGGKNWKGVDKNGNAILSVIEAEGLIADWIKTGTISDNTGNMTISLDSGEIKFSIDNSCKMILHTAGFTLYNAINEVLTSMFCSTSNKGVVTANIVMIGKRNSETTYIAEDDNGKGYISTDNIYAKTARISNCTFKQSGDYLSVDAPVQSKYGFSITNENGSEIGSLYSGSEGSAVFMLNGKYFTEKTITIDGQTITYLGV